MAEPHVYAESLYRQAGLTADDVATLFGRPAWFADAACREHPELSWFPDPSDLEAIAAVRAVCERCLVSPECEPAGRERGERFGVWAGVLRTGRRPAKVA